MDSGLPTLGTLLDRYFQLKLLAPPSRARYDLAVRNLAASIGGPLAHPSDVALARVTVDALLLFRAQALRRMRPVSFNTERRHLSALLSFAVRQRWLAENPCREVAPAPQARPLPKSIARADMLSAITLLEPARSTGGKIKRADLVQPQWFWVTVLKTFYFTGMRKRQLIGLRWEDLDFGALTIRMRSETSKNRREWLIPLPDALVAGLMELQARTVEIRGAAISGSQVFCLPMFSTRARSFRSREMRADNLDHFFQRLRKLLPADAPRITAHRIRHTTATILANSVQNLKLVQEQLGHSSILTTYGYVHPDLKSMRDALTAL